MNWTVKEVEPLSDFRLKLKFENNEVKIFNMKPYLEFGIFKKLNDEKKFRNVKISFDTVSWEDDIDIEPEFLYNESVPEIS
jgi:hypothetical protein